MSLLLTFYQACSIQRICGTSCKFEHFHDRMQARATLSLISTVCTVVIHELLDAYICMATYVLYVTLQSMEGGVTTLQLGHAQRHVVKVAW